MKTLEDYRKVKLVSATDGRPIHSMTDEKWQKEFQIRKKYIEQVPVENHKKGRKYPDSIFEKLAKQIFTPSISYRAFQGYMNSVLHEIETGNRDVCFYIYQVMALAMLHKDLQTKYLEKDQCWLVWLG